MVPLLGPILAQMITLGASDRTEARYIASDLKYYEAANYVRVGLGVGWKHTTLNLGYAPSFTVTPLESSDRQLLVFQVAGVNAAYRWQRTTLSASQSVGYGRVSFQTFGLGDPRAGNAPTPDPGANPGTTPPTGTPPNNGGGMPTTGNQTAVTLAASNQVVTYVTSSTDVSVTQLVSPALSFTGSIGYFLSAGVDNKEAQTTGQGASFQYPTVRGPRALLSSTYLFTRQDDSTSTLSAQYASTTGGNNSYIYIANQSWGHFFDKNTSSRLGAGISASKNSQPDGLIAWSIYPTFIGALNHFTTLDRGNLSFGLVVSSAPALDPVSGAVDPRVNLGGSVGWGLNKFFSFLAVNSALSLRDSDSKGALSSAAGSFTVGYRLGKVVSLDTGIRGFWQNYQGQAVVPFTWATFVGVTFAAATPLTAQH